MLCVGMHTFELQLNKVRLSCFLIRKNALVYKLLKRQEKLETNWKRSSKWVEVDTY